MVTFAGFERLKIAQGASDIGCVISWTNQVHTLHCCTVTHWPELKFITTQSIQLFTATLTIFSHRSTPNREFAPAVLQVSGSSLKPKASGVDGAAVGGAACCINPLTWSTDTAAAAKHAGA